MAPAPPPAPPTLWYVLKLTIRTRLQAVSLEAAADAARVSMTAQEQGLWNDTIVVPNDDANMIAFLKQIGADPTTILAYDDAATQIFGKR